MRLTVINGSPRGRQSNSTQIITSWMFPKTFQYRLIYAKEIIKHGDILFNCADSDAYLVIFPLYVDSLPAIAKGVFDLMYSSKTLFEHKKIYYMVHSGFPEPQHSRCVERYLRYFTGLIAMRYMGTVIMGSSEAIQTAPKFYFARKIKAVKTIGLKIKKGESLDDKEIYRAAGRETLSKPTQIINRLINFSEFYWKAILKKNGAYQHRFDKPYAKQRMM